MEKRDCEKEQNTNKDLNKKLGIFKEAYFQMVAAQLLSKSSVHFTSSCRRSRIKKKKAAYLSHF